MDLLDKVQMEDLDEEQRTFAGLVGIEAFRALVRDYNGIPIYTPEMESLKKPARDELVRKEFDGKNYHELALRYGSAETWTRDIVIEKARGVKVGLIDGQIFLKRILY